MTDAMLDEIEAKPEAERGSRQLLQDTSPLVFIHSAHRASSTWFWSKFRELPSTQCYYEPFNFILQWLTQEKAAWLGGDAWDSRHAPTNPYYREYAPLIRPTGGVELFDPAMTMEWFIPVGGLRGELRPREREYLAQLVQSAETAGKLPVLGEVWSLGRMWAIKQALGGFHIFQYRNLWPQWLSHLWYKQVKGSRTFYCSILDTIFREDDPYFQWLVERGLKLAGDPRTGQDPKASPLWWKRSYANFARDEDKVRRLELLPEPRAFALFMGLRIYLYLHAQLCADLTADATRMQRDARYRADIERAIKQHTGLAVSFADVADLERPSGVEFDRGAVDWDEVREYARVAAEMLSKYGDPAQLTASASTFVDETIEEARKDHAKPAASDAAAAPAKQAAARPAAEAKTVGLCMIVKNETKMIRRCLASVLPLVDYILVVDTGSTDGTQQMIRDFLTEHKVEGAVIDEPWRDFAYNRSFALERLREVESVDYAMVIDADDTLEFDAGFDPRAFKAQLTHDLYYVPVRHGTIAHHRPQLFSNRLPFSFKGVLHEYLEAPPGNLSRETVKGFAVQASTGGARSQNPRKYQDDAAVLERALATETDAFLISRYTFYLAQSYRDCGEREKALTSYLRRAELGYWDEEIYVSLFEAGNMMSALDRPFEQVIATYERASQTVPARAEALHAAAHYCRGKGKNAEGMEFARRGLDLALPNGLFVQPSIYNYAILDEFAINAYWAGAYRESLDACLKLLTSEKLPESMAKRIAANARFAADKLPAAKAPNLGTLGAEDLIQQHSLSPPRPLHSRVKDAPRVLVAILAKQTEPALQLYLDCIEALDYPKSSMVLYLHSNNKTDDTDKILRDWVARVGHLYHSVEFDANDYGAAGRVRNRSLRRARELGCNFYFVADTNNFIRPATLRELVALDLPIAAPLLRSTAPGQHYSNYHAEIDANGYYGNCDQYYWILERRVRGVIEVPVVNCTYLVRADVISRLTYQDTSGRHEYVVFSDSARKAGIPQYLDNRQVYGYVAGEDENNPTAVKKTLSGERAARRHVVWHRPGAIGDILITLGLVKLYKDENPNDWVIYKAAPSIVEMLRPVMLEAGIDEVVTTADQPKCDRQFDLIGYPLREGYPDKPMARHLVEYFSEELGLGGRREELTLKLPKRTIDSPYITLHASSGWSMYKNWPFDRWAWVCRELKKLGIRVIQLGGPNDPPIEGADINYIGLPFMESLALLANAELHVGIDSWSNHATNIVWEGKGKVPGVILWGSTQASAAGYSQNHNISLGLPCQPCFREDPKVSSVPRGVCPNPPGQTYEKPLHACMHGISREQVLDAIVEAYREGTNQRTSVSSLRTASALSIHLINLDRSKDRLATFQARNPHLSNVVRVSAVDGREVDKQKLIEDGILSPDCDYKPGAVGCALSHVNLWKKAVSENRIITVLEDDAVTTDRFEEKAARLISTLPDDWDFVQWGYNFDPLFVWLDFGFSKANLRFYDQNFRGQDKSAFQAIDFSTSTVRLAHSYGTVAYSVSPKGARLLLAQCVPLNSRLVPFPGTGVIAHNWGIDCAMNAAYGSMRAFVCMPPLVLEDKTLGSEIGYTDTNVP